MDLDFGISLDPSAVPQRHSFEDSDEEDLGKDEVELTVSPSSATPVEIGQRSNVIFVFGQIASIISKSFFTLHDSPSCQILCDSITVYRDKLFPAVSCERSKCSQTVSEVFGIESKDGKTYSLCVHEARLKSQYCNNWCLKVCKLLHPETVLILTSHKSYEYLSSRSQDSNPSHVLKGLQSSSWELPPLADSLEPPNTIIGEPAAVMTYCQLHSVPAAMVVSYTDSSLSISECASAFQPVFSSEFVGNLVIKPEREASQIIKKLAPKPREDLSNLYS